MPGYNFGNKLFLIAGLVFASCMQISPLSDYELVNDLYSALTDRDTTQVKSLLAQGALRDSSEYSYMYEETPLHTVVRLGLDDLALVRLLLDHNQDVNVVNEYGLMPLHYAVRSSSPDGLAITKLLIDKGANIRARTEFGDQTPLSFAVAAGSLGAVKILMDAGITLDATDTGLLTSAVRSGNRALVEFLRAHNFSLTDPHGDLVAAAVESKDPSMLTWLFEQGIQKIPTDNRFEDKGNIIHQAVRSKNRLLLHLLLNYFAAVKQDNKALINAQDYYDKTPLHLAAEQNDLDLAEELIEHGASLTEINSRNMTPLDTAVSWGNKDMVEFLFNEHKAAGHDTKNMNLFEKALNSYLDDEPEKMTELTRLVVALDSSAVNRQYENRDTPLILVARKGLPGLVQLLIDKGADVNHANSQKKTPLHKAASVGDLEGVAALVKAGARVNVQDVNGETPLMFSLKTESPDLVNFLIQAGADVNTKNNQGVTPLHYAFLGPSSLWRALMNAKADVHARDNDGGTPLYYAASTGSADAVKALVAAGAAVNEADNTGKTPLHAVAGANLYSGTNALQVLLKLGASIDVQDEDGNTPLHTAVRYPDNLQALLLNGANPFIANKAGQFPVEMLNNYHYFNPSSLYQLLVGGLGYLQARVKKEGITPQLKTYAERLFTAGIDAKKRVQIDEDDLDESILEQLIQNKLDAVSRLLNLKSAPPAVRTVSSLLEINDISVVDDKSVARPEDVFPNARLQPPFTQTEAYLSKKELKAQVLKSFEQEIVNYPRLIRKIMYQENLLKEYDVFYHGQKRDFILLYDVIKEIQNWLTQIPTSSEFEYIRLPEGQNKKLSEYLELDNLMDDTTPEMVKHLLSVNLSLFGNTSAWGSSTFSYFLESRNMRPPKDLLNEVFTKLDLNTDYVPEILQTLELLESPTGNLLQIFIPSDKVNDYVYLSLPLGVPLKALDPDTYTTLSPITITDATGTQHTYFPEQLDAKTYLELYRNHPEAIADHDMDFIQARINITHDFLLNPKSGVKIFRYTTVPPEKLSQYKEKLHTIMTNVMTEWEQKHKATLQEDVATAYSGLEETVTK